MFVGEIGRADLRCRQGGYAVLEAEGAPVVLLDNQGNGDYQSTVSAIWNKLTESVLLPLLTKEGVG